MSVFQKNISFLSNQSTLPRRRSWMFTSKYRNIIGWFYKMLNYKTIHGQKADRLCQNPTHPILGANDQELFDLGLNRADIAFIRQNWRRHKDVN